MKPSTLEWVDKADLTTYAVAFRYPGESATRDMAKLAVGDCKLIRKAIRNRLGLAEA